MFDAILSKLRVASRRGGRPDRVSILLPFVLISIGLGVLAWRSYNLSVRTEEGAKELAVQYARYASEITASRVDAATRTEMTNVADEWQQLERRISDPTFAALKDWITQHEWITSAIYLPDFDPASSIYAQEARGGAKDTPEVTREFFTSSGSIKYTFDPRRLLAVHGVLAALKQQPPPKTTGPLPISRSADLSLVMNAPAGARKLDDGYSFVTPLAAPLDNFGIRSVVRTSYVEGSSGWENQRTMSLWVSLLALVLLGIGAALALRGINKEAETMKLRGALIANVSHELRTPLAMIRLGAETLKRGKVKDKDRAEIEDQILREVLLLSHLVENVLDVARIQNNSERSVAFTPVHPRDLIRNLLTTYESWIRSKGFTYEVQIDEKVIEQMWDRDAVSRALLNLIDNAIKYSAEDKHIEVALRQDDQHVIIEVHDHGIGISTVDQARIFDPYFRAQFSDTISRRGAGLGLTLVQQIVASHGGSVEVESEAGHGSTFRLLFPRALEGNAASLPALGAPHEAF